MLEKIPQFVHRFYKDSSTSIIVDTATEPRPSVTGTDVSQVWLFAPAFCSTRPGLRMLRVHEVDLTSPACLSLLCSQAIQELISATVANAAVTASHVEAQFSAQNGVVLQVTGTLRLAVSTCVCDDCALLWS